MIPQTSLYGPVSQLGHVVRQTKKPCKASSVLPYEGAELARSRAQNDRFGDRLHVQPRHPSRPL